jgi:thiol-disulfide isomerase/thioredoxin
MNRILPLLIPAAVGSIIMLLAAALPFTERQKRKTAVSGVPGILSDALLVFLLLWKLTPGIVRFSYFSENLKALLFAPGGTAGVIAGGAGVLVLLLFRFAGKGKQRIPDNLRLITLMLLLVWSAGTAAAYTVYREFGSAPVQTAREGSLPEGGGSLTEAGSVSVVNFWASWCGPCAGELPELISFHDSIREERLPEGIRFITVNLTSTEKNEMAVTSFMADNEADFPVIYDTSGELSAYFDITSIPTTIILAPDGDELRRFEGLVTESMLRRAALAALDTIIVRNIEGKTDEIR